MVLSDGVDDDVHDVHDHLPAGARNRSPPKAAPRGRAGGAEPPCASLKVRLAGRCDPELSSRTHSVSERSLSGRPVSSSCLPCRVRGLDGAGAVVPPREMETDAAALVYAVQSGDVETAHGRGAGG